MRKFFLFTICIILFTNAYSQVILKEGKLSGVVVEKNLKVNEKASFQKATINTLPFFEGFEQNSSWDYWTIYNTSDIVNGNFVNLVTNYNGTDFSYEGEKCVCFSSYNQSQSYDQYIVTSTINIGENDKDLKASLYYRKYTYGDKEQFRVGWSFDEEFSLENCVWGETIEATQEEYQRLEQILPPNTKHFVVHYFSNFSYYLFVDAITIDYANTDGCLPVTNLTATTENGNVSLNWEAPQENNKNFKYNIFRNETLIAENITETTYVDNNLEDGNYTYNVITVCSDNSVSAPASVSVVVTSITHFSNSASIRVFPNPAKDFIYVQGEKVADMSLLDLTGKKIIAKNALQGVDNIIETKNLSNGIYFVKVTLNNGETITQKIIINR